MTETTSDSSLGIRGLIRWPTIITLGVTLLRLAGELAHWSPRFFSTAAGGGAAIVGISWLPFVFGPYFAVKLTGSGHGVPSVWKTFGLAVLGLAVTVAGMGIGFAPQVKFPGKVIVGILLVVLGPTLVTLGWPELFKTLVAYGYGARIPVAILMFFALRGHWGTHYDALPPDMTVPTSFFGMYMYVAFFPQMVFWIAFTVLAGTLFGTIVTAVLYRGKTMPATS